MKVVYNLQTYIMCTVIFFSFATGYMNRLTYLYQNGNYWSMSPSYFDSGNSSAREFSQGAAGVAIGYIYVTRGLGLRPVINLQFDNYQKMEILIDKEFIDKVK